MPSNDSYWARMRPERKVPGRRAEGSAATTTPQGGPFRGTAEPFVPAKRRVLLVEDEADNREALIEFLQACGFEVEAVGDADAALDAIHHRRADVVVTDLTPPEDQPCDFIARVRADGGPGLVIIAYSGRHHLQNAALAAGADAFILKPDVDTLERLLTGSEAGTEAQQRPKR